MPQGQNSLVPYVPPPQSSDNALANVPSGQIYMPTGGAVQGQFNSNAINNSLPMEGGSMYNSNVGLSPAGAAFLNKILPGANFKPYIPPPSNSALAQQINGVANQNTDNRNALTNIQNTIDNNQNNNSSLFGFSATSDALQEIWRYNDSNTFFNPIENMVINAAAGGGILMSQCLLRLQNSTSFLVQLNFCEASQGFPDTENLNAAIGSDQGTGQTALEYLTSVLPAYPWEDNHNGTGMTGMDWISSGDSITRSYYWSPPPLSPAATFVMVQSVVQAAADDLLNRFFHLWDYTPSSGPPTRNGITDYVAILSLLPIQTG